MASSIRNVIFDITLVVLIFVTNAIRILISFHPEMALLCDLSVNPQDYLCGIHCVCLRAIP
ncbi:MAG: hypothetical protein QG578_1845 [Thermodesulfobacteriota bacterium]|nr:hypothetical protein [Thermodesulfobacteriota bacterium]